MVLWVLYYEIYILHMLVVVVARLVVDKSITLRRVVPVLGVPDALVPLDLPVSQISLLPGY